jgi:aldehyde:ferredoxin oxidoreductase
MNPYTTKAKAKFIILFEAIYAAVNSLHICLFTSWAFILEAFLVKYTPKLIMKFAMQYLPDVAKQFLDVSIYSRYYQAITGIKMSPGKLIKAGQRIHTLERYMNTREGITRKDDTLPDRFLKEGRLNDPKKRVVPLDKLLDQYYKLRGYDENGVPKLKTLKKYGIDAK